MSKGLTLEQMKFLVGKGLTAEEMIAFAEMGATRSKAAERTARWRAKKNGTVTESVTRDGHGDASPPPIENNHTPPVSSNDETTRRRTRVEPVAKPDDVSDRVWRDWTTHRKGKGGQFTETALLGIRREADKAGITLEAALTEAITRNWQSFKAHWDTAPHGKPAAPPGDSLSRIPARNPPVSASG